MEELNKGVASHVFAGSAYAALPKSVKQAVGNEKQYHQMVLKYFLKRQMPWKRGTLIAQIAPDSRQYYQQLIKTSRAELLVRTWSSLSSPGALLKLIVSSQVFPYHLQDELIRGLRITPFKYYFDIIGDVMESGRSLPRPLAQSKDSSKEQKSRTTPFLTSALLMVSQMMKIDVSLTHSNRSAPTGHWKEPIHRYDEPMPTEGQGLIHGRSNGAS